MGHPVTTHPAADVVTPQALIIEQDRNIVPLTHWISDAAAVARNTERRLQILTPPYSSITFPLELLIREYQAGQWVVRTPDRSGFVDGLTGRPLSWNGAMFAADGGGIPAPMMSAVRSLGAGSIELIIETLHPASATLRLGVSMVAAVTALTGAEPTGWGTAEPVSQPWSARELTAFCRTRAPRPTSLVVVGADPIRGVVGMLTVTRVTTGVLEEVRLIGPASRRANQDAVEQLAHQLATTARGMLVVVHPGRVDTTRASGSTMPILPYGVLLGHRAVGGYGLDHTSRSPIPHGVRLIGTEGRRGFWCRLDGHPEGPFRALADILTHFGLTAGQFSDG